MEELEEGEVFMGHETEIRENNAVKSVKFVFILTKAKLT